MMRIRNYFIAFAVVFAISSAYALIGVQDAKAEEGAAYTDLIKRIEALESKGGGGNVTAGKIRGLKIGFNIRHRFEGRGQAFNSGAGSSVFSTTTGRSTLTPTVGKDGRANSTDVTLQRVRLTFDADINKNVRAFINLQDQRVFGEEGTSFAATGTLGNLGRTDLLEGYVEARNLGDLTPMLNNIELRIGRWQAHYGNHRLIGTLNWTNQGRAYDGARVRWADKGNWADLFAFQVEEFGPTPGGSIDVTNNSAVGSKLDEVLYGLYTHFKVYKGVVFEPYGIVRARTPDNISPATGGKKTGEQRYTAGFRLDGRKIPGIGGVDFTVEPAWQFGKVEGLRTGDTSPNRTAGTFEGNGVSNTIQAWAIYAGVGYTFKEIPWSPRIGYAYVFASGDDSPGTGGAKTFDHLYPTGHAQLGYMDNAAWQNIVDHQIHVSFKPTKKMVVDLKGHFLSLDEEADAWYGVAGGTGWGGGSSKIRSGADQVSNNGVLTNVDDTLGQEIDVTLKYKLFKNFGVVAGYSHFFADDFIQDTGNNVDRGSDWAYLQTTVKF